MLDPFPPRSRVLQIITFALWHIAGICFVADRVKNLLCAKCVVEDNAVQHVDWCNKKTVTLSFFPVLVTTAGSRFEQAREDTSVPVLCGFLQRGVLEAVEILRIRVRLLREEKLHDPCFAVARGDDKWRAEMTAMFLVRRLLQKQLCNLGDLYAESEQTLQRSFSAAAVDRIIFKN